MDDEPFWSPRRLWYAWRLWLMFTILQENTQTLAHKLRYYRRAWAEHQHNQRMVRK